MGKKKKTQQANDLTIELSSIDLSLESLDDLNFDLDDLTIDIDLDDLGTFEIEDKNLKMFDVFLDELDLKDSKSKKGGC